jgi:hypothetical protein
MTAWPAIHRVAGSSRSALQAGLQDTERAQATLLARIVTANRNTELGRRHGFASIGDARDFRARVPIATYKDYAPFVARIARGEPDVLFAGVPVAFEKTSGTTSGAKLIPYSPGALAAFRAAVLPWLADLIVARPRLRLGRAYWALSPVGRKPRRTAAGIAVGMSEDEYLGADIRDAFSALSIVPHAVTAQRDIQRWRFLTLLHLVHASDLTLVSVWSPTFFSQLLLALGEHRNRLVEALQKGFCGAGLRLPADNARARVVQEALSRAPPDTHALWPKLDTLSCWTHAMAAGPATELSERLPHAWLQGKGLLATEGAISVPLADAPHPVLAVNSAYFEFIDELGGCHESHELESDRCYRVMMTTPGGLYRYDLGDRVKCRGFFATAPMLEFVGRGALVCDLVGEKLVEGFVAERLPTQAGFCMLVPRQDVAGYALVLDAGRLDESTAEDLAAHIDTALRENPQYAYARELGQLARVAPWRVVDPQAAYLGWALARGQRLGDIKPVALSRDPSWLANGAGPALALAKCSTSVATQPSSDDAAC